MKKLLVGFLFLTGCLQTQTKTDLKRPDFSKPQVAAVSTETAPVQTKTCSGCCKKASLEHTDEPKNIDDINRMLKQIEDYFNEHGLPQVPEPKHEYY